MNSSADVKRKKDSGENMTIAEKILWHRQVEGLGEAEAVKVLQRDCNHFDGPWYHFEGDDILEDAEIIES